MSKLWVLFFLLTSTFTVSAQTKAIDCRNWSIKNNFELEAKEDLDYKTAIEAFFNQHSIKSCPDVAKSSAALIPPAESLRCISTKGIAGLESLPCFHYQFLSASGEAKGTVINFQGGPADIFTPSAQASSDYNEIAFNDIGVGDNSLDLNKGIRWKSFSASTQSQILRRILKKENVTNYVLSGGSFGSVTATQVAAELSKEALAPKAVLLVGVVPSTKEKASRQSSSEVKLLQTGVDPDFSGGCILKGSAKCVDGEVLKLLTADERDRYQQKVAKLAVGPEQAAFRALLRDAFHWEFAHGPNQAAEFLRRNVLVDDHVSAMSCWYGSNFSEIPWLNRFKTASQLAFYQINNCRGRTKANQMKSQDCACLPEIKEYHPAEYQIKPPTKLYYINGTVDSQTPIEGAEKHFREQKNSEKAFLKICGGGHMPMSGRSRERRTVSEADVYKAIFSGGLKDFEKIDGYCGGDQEGGSAGAAR